MTSSVPPSIASFQEVIDALTAIQQDISRMKASLRACMQQRMLASVGRRTPEEEVFYQVKHLGDPTASDIHNFAKWIDRATIIDILEKFMASGQVRQRKTPHTIRYRLVS